MGNFDRARSFCSALKMDTTTWLTLILAVVSLATPALSSEPRVVCYYTNWSVYRPGTARFNPQNINPYLCTHLVYAFGGFTKDNTLKPFDKYQDIEKGGYAKFTGLKTYNKNLKTLLAIGGWNEGSTRFSPMVGSKERRKEFVRNAIKFLRQNRFDGLDLDWEYPASRDGGKQKDRENYSRLVRELREEFEREAEKTGKPRLLLTMAVPAGIEYIQKGYDVKTLNKYLDWMNLLSYDYHSAFEPAVNHHAPLYPLEEPNEYSVDNELNIDYTIKFYLESGADRDKLVLGIPTYGRSYTLFNADAVEIGSPADGPGEQGEATREKGYLAYYEICESLKPKNKKRNADSEEDSEEESEEEEEWTVMHPNPSAMGPVAFKGNQWVGYDDVEIVKKKGEYVAENGLGGIMFWSIDNDDFRGNCHGKPYPLIEAAKEAYIGKLGSTDNAIATERSKPASRPSSNKRRNRPKAGSTTTTTTTTTSEPLSAIISNKRKNSLTSTTPSWNIITPEPPTTPDPGSDFKCVDEGFYPHPRDCKKYFWCLDSGPSDLGIVANQFTCPSGLYFNKAVDSCDFARNVPCKKPEVTTKSPSKKTTTTTAPTTTRKPIRLSTKNSVLFRTTTPTSTTTESESEEEYEDGSAEDTVDEDAEDPKVIKELIDLIRKAGGVEQLEKQLHLSESFASTDGGSTTTPSSFNKKLYQKVLDRARGKNKFGSNSIIETAQNSRRGPQNQGIQSTPDKDRLLKKDRPQYTTINRQRTSYSSSTQEPLESDEAEDESEEEVQELSRARAVETEISVGTTTKPLQYVNIRRARPTLTTSDSGDDSASRNALFERTEPLVTVSETVNSLDIANARKESAPEYVTIRRQRPTTEETTTVQYQDSKEEVELQETALEREISSQPQYSSIIRTRSTTVSTPGEPSSSEPTVTRTRSTTFSSPEELSSPEPTTVLAIQISSLLNFPSSEMESALPETTLALSTEAAEPTTISTTTTTPSTTTTAALSNVTPRRTILRRRGSSTTSTTRAPSSSTQAPKRNFLRRTKATAPPDTTEVEAATIDNIETTTNKFTRRGGSKFKNRKEIEQKEAAGNDTGRIEKNEIENRTRRPSFSNSARRSERPTATRNFVRKRLGGANVTITSTSSSPGATSSATVLSTRRSPFKIGTRRRPFAASTTTTSTTSTTTQATTTLDSEESLQDIGDIDAIEDPSLEPRVTQKKTPKIQRRPLVTLKEELTDQNPSATSEDEGKRQSKKYSSTFKQDQLDDLLRIKSQEGATTLGGTTLEEYNAETALAIAAHQLISAPLPNIQDSNDDIKTVRTQTTQEFKYTYPDYNEYTGKPAYEEYSSTPIYKINGNQEYVQTTIGNTYSITSDFDASKISPTTTYEGPKSTLGDDFSTLTRQQGSLIATDFDAPKISTTTFDIPKTTSTDAFSPTLPRQTQYSNVETGYSSPQTFTTNFAAPKTTLAYDFSTTKSRRPEYSSISTDYDSKNTNTRSDTPTTTTIPDGFSTTRSRRPGYTGISTDFDSKITFSNVDSPKTTESEGYSTIRSRRPGYSNLSTDYDSKITTSDASKTTIKDDYTRSRRPGYTGTQPDYNSKITTTNIDGPTTTITDGFSTTRSRLPGYIGISTDYDSKITNINSDATTTLTDDLVSATRPRRPGYSSISTDYDSKITTTNFDAPKTTAIFSSNRSRRPGYTGIPADYDSKITTANFEVPKSTATLSRYPTTPYQTVTNQYVQTTGDYTDTPTDYSSSKIPSGFTPSSSAQSSDVGLSTLSILTPGYPGIQRGSSTRYLSSTEKYVAVPAEGYSTVGHASSSQEPSYFTREYLLESPVTKTYDDEYQYLSPSTTPLTTTRKLIRKKIHRKISTTLPPTTPTALPPATTPKPRRVPTKKPFEKISKVPNRTYRPVVNYDYYDDSAEKVAEKYAEGTKVILHGKGSIECLDVGNFPHPSSCKKFISCARMEFGALLGWAYVCPQGLSFDPVGGICNWSAGLGCDEKDI